MLHPGTPALQCDWKPAEGLRASLGAGQCWDNPGQREGPQGDRRGQPREPRQSHSDCALGQDPVPGQQPRSFTPVPRLSQSVALDGSGLRT